MANNATAAGPRFSESLSVLIDRPTRELIMGLALTSADAAGTSRPKEGETLRGLIAAAVDDLERTMSKRAFQATRARGAKWLADRDAEAAARKRDALAQA
jgi:hypothetical protein